MSIVQLNVSQTLPPVPNVHQRKGALVSQGGTTLAAGTTTLLRSPADITTILAQSIAIANMVWAANIVTVTTSAPHGIAVDDSALMTIAGTAPAAYNGTLLVTAVDAVTLTYPLVANPGAVTTEGTIIPASAAEVAAMASTFFIQQGGSGRLAVWVLELGAGGSAAGIAALDAYITANTVNNLGPFYAYLVPGAWSDDPTFGPFAAKYTALTAKTYFFPHLTVANYTTYTNYPGGLKSVFGLVPAPSAPSTEFSLAAAFFVALNYSPSATNKVTPTDNSFVYGVTPWPPNSSVYQQIAETNVNAITTGSEGGISNLIIQGGTTLDGHDFTYWYSVDWAQINVKQGIAAEVINGANNPQAPLLYNQNGIERLQRKIASVMGQAVSYALAIGTPVQVSMSPNDFEAAVEDGDFAGQIAINARDFLSYSAENPDDYAAGLYNGFQIAFIPARGFKHIIINMNVTEFVRG